MEPTRSASCCWDRPSADLHSLSLFPKLMITPPR
nr:MAG TPA: hypothetical protein [Caudoviricetes sp.]